MREDCTMVSSEKRTCSECFKICRSDACFNHHKKSRKLNRLDLPSKCHKSYRCQTCLTIVDRERQDKHRCGESICHICKEFVLRDHLCYMQTEQPKTPNDKLSNFL